jgi:hypothetical protein
MKQLFILSGALYALPFVVFAQARGTLGFYIVELVHFFDRYVIPLILGLAFLFFIWNISYYFIIGGASDEKREIAKRNVLWGMLAFVLLASVWGIVHMLVYGLNITGFAPICPDYNPNCRG